MFEINIAISSTPLWVEVRKMVIQLMKKKGVNPDQGSVALDLRFKTNPLAHAIHLRRLLEDEVPGIRVTICEETTMRNPTHDCY